MKSAPMVPPVKVITQDDNELFTSERLNMGRLGIKVNFKN
jgi:hypothetical protein